MKIIFSRKGFDSASGGVPSPIFQNGRLLSLPIPDEGSKVKYKDIRWNGYDLGQIVSSLTKNRITRGWGAHLDPDLNAPSIPRKTGWKPIFGQTSSAQSHLANQGVAVGDIFIFFGLFREVGEKDGKLVFVKGSLKKHVIWGWMQIGEMVKIDSCDRRKLAWASYHPHFSHDRDELNTLYIAKDILEIPDMKLKKPGAGVFKEYSNSLLLSDKCSSNASQWRLPRCFYPKSVETSLSYHSDLKRWTLKDSCVLLKSCGRGQEFVLDAEFYPESVEWVLGLLQGQ